MMKFRTMTYQELKSEIAERDLTFQGAATALAILTDTPIIERQRYSRHASRHGAMSVEQTQKWRLFFLLYDGTNGLETLKLKEALA